jgi:hypothetical protein
VETTSHADLVELDHRSSPSFDVSLFWHRNTDVLFVQVIDWLGEDDFCVRVHGSVASQAFRHPFAYYPGCGSVLDGAQ